MNTHVAIAVLAVLERRMNIARSLKSSVVFEPGVAFRRRDREARPLHTRSQQSQTVRVPSTSPGSAKRYGFSERESCSEILLVNCVMQRGVIAVGNMVT